MNIGRRTFLGVLGATLGAAAASPNDSRAARQAKAPEDPYGCMVDLTLCIGCRKCELACNQVNDLPEPEIPFDDLCVLETKRRPDEKSYTVVNRYPTGRFDEQNHSICTYVKVQCMHCQDPACVSACIVGALTKKENGAVHYDVTKCIGCRYCMVACPFQIPAYEYHDPITPRVMKCTFCYDRISKQGGTPGCASICPVEAITFGKRSQLMKLAHEKLKEDPGRYRQKVYGETEVGGTSWLYISKEPFERLGFPTLPEKPMPHLTETIQHGVFAYLWAPLTLFGLLGGAMWFLNRRQITGQGDSGHTTDKEAGS